jgi:hypothetical protein
MVAGGGGGERPSPRWASYLHELMISRICKERSLDCCFLPDVRKAASYAEQAEHFYYDVVRRGAPEPDEPRKLRRLDQLVERLGRRRTEAEEVLQAGSGGGGAFYLINFLVNGEDCHGGLIPRTSVARLLEVHPTSWMFSCPGAGGPEVCTCSLLMHNKHMHFLLTPRPAGCTSQRASSGGLIRSRPRHFAPSPTAFPHSRGCA